VSQDNDALIATLRQALDRNPEDPLLRRNLVSILVQIGRTDDALAVLAQRPEMVRKDPGLLRLQVAAAQATGNTGLAREAVETLLQIAPESAAAHQSLARILAASGGGREMEEAFLEALRLDPESPKAAATLAVVMDATKAPDERERIAEAMNRVMPDHYLVKLARARLALRATDYREAADAFRDALDMKPDDRSALRGLVAALSRLGKEQDAANALAAWTTRHPDDLAARYDLAVTLERAGDTAGAVEIYEALLGDRPEHWMAMNNLAMLLLDGDPRRALSLAQRAHELNKESGAILDTLGLAALANDQPEHAVDVLSTAREKAPTDPRIALHLAEALVAAGRPAEASPILMEISTRLFPGRADAQSLLEQLRQGR
jgi:Flp pilus assembly protein TadD